MAFELLGEGRRLADSLGEDLSAVLFGTGMSEGARSLIEAGADKVYLIEDPLLNEFHEDAYADALSGLIEKYKPEIVLAGATSIGRAFVPIVATRVRTGLTADCTALAIDTEKKILLQTRPAFGGNIMATIACPDNRPQMSTVRPGVMKRLPADSTRTGEIIKEALASPLTSKTKLIETIEEAGHKINISEAEIIVAGGRGMGEREGFRAAERGRGRAWRSGRRDARGGGLRLGAIPAPDRPDRTDGEPEALYRLRYIRRYPAPCGNAVLRFHNRDKQGPGRSDIQRGRYRHRGRRLRGAPGVREEAQGDEGLMANPAFIFPGQGSQYVGMGKGLYNEYPEARAIFDEASGATGVDLAKLCFEGPDSELNRTENTQPAILTASLAVLAVLGAMHIKPVAAAGHSLGELTAVAAAGGLTAGQAAAIAKKRGKFMQEAVPEGKGLMAAVLGLDAEKIREACAEASSVGVVAPGKLQLSRPGGHSRGEGGGGKGVGALPGDGREEGGPACRERPFALPADGARGRKA